MHEIICLALTIFLESRGESLAGQRMVGEVILNRVASDRYPDTICDVVNQPNQFATHSDVTYTDWEIRNAARVAVDLYRNHIPDPEVLWFFDPEEADPAWADELVPVAVVGNHLFLRKPCRPSSGDCSLENYPTGSIPDTRWDIN